jgi:thymidylate synthase
MRSNDGIFGLTNDIPTFSFYHEMLYVYLRDTKYPDLELGEYTHLADSFHIYERHYKMLKNIIQNAYEHKVECPKIESAIEVDKLLNCELDESYEFSKWLKT